MSASFKIDVWNAWIFMSVFILQMIIVMCAGSRLRTRSHVPPEARRTVFDKYTGIAGNLVWFSALGYSVFLPLRLGTLWFYSGLFLFVPGVIILALATYTFMNTPADQMIKSGVYKYSRHPMYAATFLICMGSGIAAASWIFVILSVIMAFCFRNEAIIEEIYCLDTYKDEYEHYMKAVPRWLGISKSKGFN